MHILLADANPAVRTALRLLIEQQAGFRVIGECPDAINLFAQVTNRRPDVVLLDVDLPGLQLPRRSVHSSLAELIQTLRSLAPTLRVIALSSQPTAQIACLRAQADAFICKSDPPDALITLLECTLRSVTH